MGDFGTSHSGVSKGGIAGIVIAVGTLHARLPSPLSLNGCAVLGSLLLLLLILCLHRRRRQRRRLRLEDGTSVLAATSHETKDSLLRTADASPDTRTYGNIPPSTANIDSAAVPLVAAAALAGHAGHRTRESSGADLMRSPTTSSLPNPHDMHDEPLLMPTMHSSRNVDRDLPPVPVEHTDVPDVSRLSSTFSSRSSYPPSSFSDPAAFLTRGNTSRTTASTASTLHSEMAVYQKRLEAHHEKEMQARDDAAPSGGLPLEPPPEYQETLPMNSTSDLGEISHGTDAHRE